jgi:hypothetical protein
MKFKLLIPLFCFFIFTSCSVNRGDDVPTEQNTVIQWNLINVRGGVAGVNHNFELGEIIWVFDDSNGILSIENNNTDDTLEDGFNSGNYTFYYIDDDFLNLYITIGDTEFGSITISENNLYFIINQNETSTNGTGADGFIYLFEKTTATF